MPPANCTAYLGTNVDTYGRPLPWIGLYVAGVSLACCAGMSIDLYHSIRTHKFWINSKLFTLNATALTILAIATKLPSDLTTPMPGTIDQLAKLAGIVLVSITMNHVMPSLGMCNGAELVSNVIALGILVVTLFVNVWIQIYTGVVVKGFVSSYILLSVAMLVIFLIFASYSLTVTTTRRTLEVQYNKKHVKILQDLPDDRGIRFSVEQLGGYINKYWLMALTSSPNYTAMSSGLCSASTVLCYGTIGNNFIQAVARLLSSDRNCSTGSDYGWSVTVIFGVQIVTITVGVVASVMRDWHSKPTDCFQSWRDLLRIEKHWVQLIVEWKEAPICVQMNRNRRTKKAVHTLKNLSVSVLLILQITTIMLCRLFSLKFFYGRLQRCLRKFFGNCWCCCGKESDEEIVDPDMKQYVIQLEGGEESILAEDVVRRWQKYPERWIESGRRSQPKHLLNLVQNNHQNSNMDLPFGLHNHVIDPKSWALPLVTLATILHLLLLEHGCTHSPLVLEVREAFRYIRFVEYSIGSKTSDKCRVAADMVWETLDLNGWWLDVDLNELVSDKWSDVISKLRRVGMEHVEEYKDEMDPMHCPPKLLAAKCMSEITEAMLLKTWAYKTKLELVQELSLCVVEIILMCLVQLPLAVFVHCSSGEFGAREEKVREAALVFGETEEILKFMEVKVSNEPLRDFTSTTFVDLCSSVWFVY